MVATQSGVNGKSEVLLEGVGKRAIPEVEPTLSHSSMGRTAMPSEEPARRRSAARTSSAVCLLKVAFNPVY